MSGRYKGDQTPTTPPLIVLETEGGVIHGEYIYAGMGTPALHVLDMDTEGMDAEELRRFADAIVEACADMEGKIAELADPVEQMADRNQIAEWTAKASDLYRFASEIES